MMAQRYNVCKVQKCSTEKKCKTEFKVEKNMQEYEISENQVTKLLTKALPVIADMGLETCSHEKYLLRIWVIKLVNY
jgi:hypothetical protein